MIRLVILTATVSLVVIVVTFALILGRDRDKNNP